MNSFSIAAYENQPVLDTYKKWLVDDVYNNFNPSDIDNPNFMQKLSFLQAEGVRHDIAMHAAVTHGSIQSAGAQIGVRIQNAANLITSSLDDGFALMNNRMIETNRNLEGIGQGIGQMNQSIAQGNQLLYGIRGGIAQTNRGIAQINQGVNAIATGMNTLNNSLLFSAQLLSNQISQAASMIKVQLQQVENALYQILDELRIPESQRERRYHIEEGIKYFSKGMQTGDCLYFEDALDEFSTALSIERKDYFSWYYLGMIYLYSKDNIDLEKAISSFDRYIHYAAALPLRHYLFDEVLMMKAECHYLEGNPEQAYKDITDILTNSIKATLRGVKYLSCSGKADEKIKATEIFKQLVEKNPYLIMQVLEDYDIVANDFIMQYISEYKNRLVIEIKSIFSNNERDLDLLSRPIERELIQDIILKKQHLNQLKIMDLLKLRDDIFDIEHCVAVRKSLGSIVLRCEQVVKAYAQAKKIISENDNYILKYDNERTIQDLSNKINKINNVIDEKTKEELTQQLDYWAERSIALLEDLNENDFLYDVNSNGLGVFRGKRSHIDIMPSKWKYARSFQEGLAVIEDDSYKFGYIDGKGDIVLPCKWCSAGDFSDGIAPVKRTYNEAGYINKSGKVVIEFQFSDAKEFSDGLAAVLDKDGKRGWGYIDKSGKIIIDYHWDFVNDFHERLAVVKDKEKHTYVIDKTGKIVIVCSRNYKDVYDFSEGMAQVTHVNGLCGYINKYGNEVIPCKWKFATKFQNGLALVHDKDGKPYYIDKSGHIVKKI